MNWVAATLLSAFFLGIYDLCTKHSVRANAVTPVFFFQHTHRGAGMAGTHDRRHKSRLAALLRPSSLTRSWHQHFQIFLKSTVVAASWIGTYYALKFLPLSLGAPIRATSPLLTLFGAIIFLGERPTWLEILGVLTTLASLLGCHSPVPPKASISIGTNGSGRFDRRQSVRRSQCALRQISARRTAHFTVPTVQCWFSIYLRRLIFCAVFHRLETTAVAAQHIHLALDHSLHRDCPTAGGLCSIFGRCGNSDRLVAVVMRYAGPARSSLSRAESLLFKELNAWRKLPAVIGILVGSIADDPGQPIISTPP